MSAIEAIRTRFTERLEQAELRWRPFPHLLLTEVLPADVYDAAMESDPFGADPGRPFGDPSWTKKLIFEQHYDRRMQHALDRAERTLHHGVWPDIGDAFGDPSWLGPVLRARFPEYFELRFGNIDAVEAESPGFWGRLHTRTFLQRHDDGYQLAAHTDIPTRIATCIFGFPPGPGFEDAGTQLLEPIDPRWRCSGNRHHPTEGFRVVGTAPYSPNSCLVFFRTRHSWHSVSPGVASVPGGRLGMQVQLYESEEGAVVDLSDPDSLKNRQFRADRLHERVARRVRHEIHRLRHR